MIMARSGFQSRWGAGGVFNCGICKRRTRHVDQGMSHLCPQCDEWTAAENSVNDGNYDGEPPEELKRALDRIQALKEEAAKRGGSRESLGLEIKQ